MKTKYLTSFHVLVCRAEDSFSIQFRPSVFVGTLLNEINLAILLWTAVLSWCDHGLFACFFGAPKSDNKGDWKEIPQVFNKCTPSRQASIYIFYWKNNNVTMLSIDYIDSLCFASLQICCLGLISTWCMKQNYKIIKCDFKKNIA